MFDRPPASPASSACRTPHRIATVDHRGERLGTRGWVRTLGVYIGLAALLPSLAFVVTSSLSVRHQSGVVAESQALQQLTGLTSGVRRVIHALQRERGLSALLLAGPPEASLEALLEEAREATDAEAWRFFEDSARLPAQLLRPGLRSLLPRMWGDLQGLAHRRGLIDGRHIALLAAVEDYTRLVGRLMSFIEHLPGLGQNAVVAELLLSYEVLLRYKDQLGLERALSAALLRQSGQGADLRQAYAHTATARDELLARLVADAPDPLLAGVRAQRRSATARAVEELRGRLRAAAEGNAPSPPGDTPAAPRGQALAAFALMSRYIDGFQQIGDGIVAELQRASGARLEAARRQLHLMAGTLLAVFAGLVAIGVVLTRRLIGEARRREADALRIRELALFDPLTRLPNRVYLNAELARRLEGAAGEAPLAVHLVDVHDFTEVNRIWGEEVADAVLAEVARRLRGFAGAGLVGRLYGDDFLVLQVGAANAAAAASFAAELAALFAEPVRVAERLIGIEVGIGIALHPEHGADASQLLAHAAAAARVAKSGAARSPVQIYSAEMHRSRDELRVLGGELRDALARDELELHYQPKVDLATGAVAGVEALLRWHHPSRGLVPPGLFIPQAEREGVIVDLGAWVLGEACRQARRWQLEGLHLEVAVNMSPAQFAQADLVAQVERSLADAGAPAALLQIEVTETDVMTDLDGSVARLDALARLGVGLSIDDFGTGYSSLAYLKRFPVSCLKVDRTFVSDLPGDSQDAMITQGIVALAHSLELSVVGEGVETAAQEAFLRACGCEEAQGYLYSRPLPAPELRQWLEASGRAATASPARRARHRGEGRAGSA